jgi:hypothetical protein
MMSLFLMNLLQRDLPQMIHHLWNVIPSRWKFWICQDMPGKLFFYFMFTFTFTHWWIFLWWIVYKEIKVATSHHLIMAKLRRTKTLISWPVISLHAFIFCRNLSLLVSTEGRWKYVVAVRKHSSCTAVWKNVFT